MRKPRALKPGEALYIRESLKPGSNKVEAARRAGLDYVPHGAHVQRAREELIKKQLELADITAHRVVLELARIAFFDPRRMFDKNGNLVPIQDLDIDTAAAIQSFDVERRTERHGDETEVYYVLKPRVASKNEALKTLAQFEKLPGDGDASTGPMLLPQVIVNFVDRCAAPANQP